MASPLRDPTSLGHRAARAAFRWTVAAYYPDLVLDGTARIPSGPLVVAANHPNSLVDPVLLSAMLPRRIHWLAKATLFESTWGRMILGGLGAIPVHRRHEGGTRDTTTAVLRIAADAVVAGRAIGIFPEGTTHDEYRLKELKSGAARIAILAARDIAASGGGNPVNIVPVVLHFPEKARFRSGALVLVGEPIEVQPHDSPEDLTETIRRRLEELLVHVEDKEQERVLRAVRVLLRRRHALGGDLADAREAHRQDREIAAAIRRFSREEPERAEEFRRRLFTHVERLDRQGFSLHALEPAPVALHRSALAVASLPAAAWGLLHSFIPYAISTWFSRRFARKADLTTISTFALMAGVVAFPLCWLPWTWWAWSTAGAFGAALFLVTAPITALIARWSLHVLRHDIGRMLDFTLAAAHPRVVKALKRERAWLWSELERWRALHLESTPSSPEAS
jgi:1-acyl-sn-glycerol-3-phosphate acyltransferase